MKFSTVLHILTAITATIFAWNPKAEIGAVLFVLLMIEGMTLKMSAKIDKTPVKSKISDYFDKVWNKKRNKLESALFFIPAFIWFFISWFLIPQFIIEQFRPFNYCPENIIENGNILVDFAAQIACFSQFMILPFFIIATTAIVFFACGIWILSKVECIYLRP